MKDKSDVQGEKTPSGNRGLTLGCLMAGLGIGIAVSIFFAPKSGAETRQWIANKCLDGVDTANEKVLQTRLQVMDMLNQGQQKINKAVAAGLEAIGKS